MNRDLLPEKSTSVSRVNLTGELQTMAWIMALA
jgi:hypothetical protein